MATDTPQQPAMEDILTSIRTGVEDETAKVGRGSADLIDAAAEQDGEEDVLELSADDMIGSPVEDEAEELIDIAAFATNGEAKAVDRQTAADLAADILGEAPQPEPVAADVADVNIEGAADEFDRLLAEISQEQQQQVAAAHVTKQALMDEEDPLGTEPAAVEEVAVEDEPEAEPEDMVASLEDAVVAESVAAFVPPVATESGPKSLSVSAFESVDGVQLAFPAEVLAMALRPMVQDWLTKNLPSVVERLVKDEISKLTQN
ncbi:MAG: DUF2497 domain-containing protein [Alphaproteobacteria bacterium]|nr:MAG: DUF2497 domain-containing protein [Alphaproteobacteria bacterium]